jgi:hypothetical protein
MTVVRGLRIVLVAVLCSLAGCWQMGAERNVEKNGIRFETFRQMKDGTKIGVLQEDTVIDGWPVKKDFIVFYPDWRLDELELSRDYERNGIFMPEGTWVFPDAQGNPGVCMFPRDIEIQGHLVRGSRMGKEGFMTYFYNNGKLKLFWTREPVGIDGWVCKDSLFTGISLHANGRLRECILDKPVTAGGVSYRKGGRIQLNESGEVINYE